MTTLKEHLSRLGRKGGRRTAVVMTAEQRRERARKGGEARWAKHKKEKQ